MFHRLALSAIFAAGLAGLSGGARAEGAAGDRFTASQICPAFQSFRKGTNPGDVSIAPGTVYELIGVNGNDPTHYRIRTPGAEPPERWVALECGSAGIEAVATTPSKPGTTAAAGADPRGAGALADALSGSPSAPTRSSGQKSPAGSYVLAASWHAAFCEGRSRSRDCRSGGMEDGLKLHGLWPQTRGTEYCGVSRGDIATDQGGRWRDLPQPDITMATEKRLAEAMPGVVAGLHKHEWIKHGTCYGGDAEEYFADSLALVEKLNASAVGALFRKNRGRELTNDQIRAAFDDAFGRGAGKRVLVDCNDDEGRAIINELRINLKGRITPESDLKDLIGSASGAPRGCPSGIVDRSGDQ